MANENEVLDGAEETAEETVEEQATLLTEGEDNADDKAGSQADASSDDESKEEEAEDKIPETYEFKMPEGVTLDEARAAEFSEVAKDAALTQGQADKVVGMYVKVQEEMAAKQQERWTEVLNDWREQSTKDAEFGGAKFQESVANAKRALDVFGNEELKEALNQSGMGNHPELIRMLNKVGAAAADDSFVFGKEQGEQRKSAADILFPNQGKS